MTEKLNENENLNTELFGPNDFVFTQLTDEDGNITTVGGGYKVDSFFFKNGISPLTTINNSGKQDGGKVSSPFENLAVPAGLFYVNQRMPKSRNYEYKEHEMISDDVFDKLFKLVEVDKKRKRKTRKNIKKLIHNKTHRTSKSN